MAWWAVLGLAFVTSVPTPTPPPSSVPAVVPAVAAPATSTPIAPSPVDPLGCDAVVHDPSGELAADTVGAAAARVAVALGADLHVRAERDLDGGLDVRMAQLEAQCPGWSTGTDRAPELVVVMYSSTEREASVFYGAGQADPLEFRWEHAVDVMGPRFADGDATGGVVAGLEALREDAPTTYQPSFDAGSYGDESTGGSSGVPAIVWLLLITVVVVAFVRVAGFARTGEWSSDDVDDDGGRGPRRTRSTSSWSAGRSSRRTSSSSSRRSSSSSRHSSSSSRRSSGRSGGGTKNW